MNIKLDSGLERMFQRFLDKRLFVEMTSPYPSGDIIKGIQNKESKVLDDLFFEYMISLTSMGSRVFEKTYLWDRVSRKEVLNIIKRAKKHGCSSIIVESDDLTVLEYENPQISDFDNPMFCFKNTRLGWIDIVGVHLRKDKIKLDNKEREHYISFFEDTLDDKDRWGSLCSFLNRTFRA